MAQGYLLDTNVISELRKGPRCNHNVRAWMGSVPVTACYLSRITLAEIMVGIERQTDQVFRLELEAWLRNEVRPSFGQRILDVDERVLVRWRHITREAQSRNYTFSAPDDLIAATALTHGLTVATRNTADFVQARVPHIDPWQYASIVL